MALRRDHSTGNISRAYAWLEASRCRLPGRADGPSDAEHRERVVYGVLRALVGAVEQDEPTARGHADRVGALSRRLAIAIGLAQEEADLVGEAGLLHDIGKLGVARRRVGAAATPLPCHCTIGAQLVAPFEFLALAAPMIRHHHERLDGRGHPDGLRGINIPVGARIIAVADAYERLTGADGMGGALTHEAALATMGREAGRTLDPTVVSALVHRALP